MGHKTRFSKAEVESTAERVISRNRGDIAVAERSARENGRWMRSCRFQDRGTFWDLVAEAISSR